MPVGNSRPPLRPVDWCALGMPGRVGMPSHVGGRDLNPDCLPVARLCLSQPRTVVSSRSDTYLLLVEHLG